MSFSVGIVGLPNVGKSTLFKALTKKPVDIAPYPFTTIRPNIGIVQVPDEKLTKIAKIIKPEKITPTIIEFVDIAGLVRGAHKGEGLGNQFLAHIRNCDAILEVVRAFEETDIENVLGEVNPKKESEIIKVELLMKDLETLENAIAKPGKQSDKQDLKKIAILQRIKEEVSEGKLISELNLKKEEREEIKEYQFLTQKPIFFILNVNEKYPEGHILNKNRGAEFSNLPFNYLVINLKEEGEFSELSAEELREIEFASQLDKLILSCYNILDLITFYTVAGGKETRAWTVKKGSTCPQAGGIVHSDFENKFIRAEVIAWQSLIEAGSWSKARELGWLKIVGHDFLVRDGDIIEFKI